MLDSHYSDLKERLRSHPKQLETASDWLFVLGNTMRAMIASQDKSQVAILDGLLEKTSKTGF